MATRTHLPAVLKALRFHHRSTRDLEAIPLSAWPALIHSLDRAHLTLALASRCGDSVPKPVRQRFDRNLASNRVRYERLVAAQSQITDALSLHGIEYMILKGLAQWPWYADDPAARPQYDIDIYVPHDPIALAAKTVRALGYEFAGEVLDPSADHLPVMIRRTGWTWRRDYFDPEMPFSLELHFRLWNSAMMRFCSADFGPFWQRRVRRKIVNLRFQTLHPVDGLSYSAMHLVRHLLHGDMRLSHVYEIAHFLERSSGADGFWSEWRETALRPCRIMEGIAFCLARDWFHCQTHPAAQAAIEDLPASIQRWFSLFASSPQWSPSTASDGSAKNEIWLHFCLLTRTKDKRAILIRRLLPKRRTRVLLHPHLSAAEEGTLLRVRRAVFEITFITRRALHHLRTLVPTLRGALQWCFACGAPADRKHCSETAQP